MQKGFSKKILKWHRKTPMLEIFFGKVGVFELDMLPNSYTKVCLTMCLTHCNHSNQTRVQSVIFND